MRSLLLHPPLARRSFSELALVPEPLAELAVGTELRARGHEVRLIDLRRVRSLTRALGAFRPDFAFVSVSPLTHGSLGKVLGELRRSCPQVRIMLLPAGEYGNEHVLERPDDYRHPQADALAARYFFRDLMAGAAAVAERWHAGAVPDDVPGLHLQRSPGVWEETEPLPSRPSDYGVPQRTLLGKVRGSYVFGGVGGTAYVCSSFGCQYSCRYCTMSKWTGQVFRRDLDDVVAELAELTERNVFLSDFEPLLAPNHMQALAERIERAGIRKRFYIMTRADSVLEHVDLLQRWKPIGLRAVFLGLDGHSSDQLKRLNKACTLDVGEAAVRKLRELGLFVSVGMLVRPDFTREDFRDLRRYVHALRPPAVGFSVETPLVGTRLFDDTREQITTSDWSLFDLQHAVLPTRLSLREFYREMVKLHLTSLRLSRAQALRQFSLREQVRGGLVVAPRLLDLWFGHRHHERPLPPAVQRPLFQKA